MWDSIVRTIKGMFAAKSGIQVGKTNQTATGTFGDGSHGVIANNFYNMAPAPEKANDRTETLTKEEAEILLSMIESHDGALYVTSARNMLWLSVSGKHLTPPNDPELAMRIYEGFERLYSWGMVKDMTGEGHTYHLTTKGRDGVQQVRNQLAELDFTALETQETKMPSLFRELREDVAAHPLIRQAVLVQQRGDYQGKTSIELYYATHPTLDAMFDELVKADFVDAVSDPGMKRYRLGDKMVYFLRTGPKE
jgi:hypothetical protein